MRYAVALAGALAVFFSGGGHAEPCAGTQVHFSLQRSQAVAVDRLQANLYTEVQAADMATVNARLNRISQAVKAAAEPYAPEVVVQTRTFRSWPVYDAKRKVIMAWRGRYGVQVKGPLADETLQAVAALQRQLTLSGIMPLLSDARRRAVREKLELAVLKAAKQRVQAYGEALGLQQAKIRTVRFDTAGAPQPLLRTMMKRLDAAAAPAVSGGERDVAVRANVEACLLAP